MTKIEKLLFKPLNIFQNKWILRSVIFSTLILFILLSTAHILSAFFNDFFQENIFYYNAVKNTVYSYLQICLIGYFIYKYKFCYWSIISYYGICYFKLSWLIDFYLFKIPDWVARLESLFFIYLLITILYSILKTEKNE